MIGLNNGGGRIGMAGFPVERGGILPVEASQCITRPATPEELAAVEEKLRAKNKARLRERERLGVGPEDDVEFVSKVKTRELEEERKMAERKTEKAERETEKTKRETEKTKRRRFDREEFCRLIRENGFTLEELAQHFGISEQEAENRARAYHLVREVRKNGIREQEGVVARKKREEPAKAPRESRDFPQDQEPNECRYLSPVWLNELAKGLTAGAVKHPGETWRKIPAREHLYRAMRHIVLWLMGDDKEPHIVNASMRLMMAFETAKEES